MTIIAAPKRSWRAPSLFRCMATPRGTLAMHFRQRDKKSYFGATAPVIFTDQWAER
jgi:hypothetical protein